MNIDKINFTTEIVQSQRFKGLKWHSEKMFV